MPTTPVREPLSPWPFAGVIGLACVAFLIGATPEVVGTHWWVVLPLGAVWVVALLLAIQWFTARPRTVVVLPVVVALVWLATILAGARWLGWGLAGGA
ncbi:hypothetical protein L2K70_16360 [Nocardioides KLBMP 9356]|uniref:DUF4175 domain-containing protein n=1 Tax=Nocardioides potassii TaxID=2911371 RepID=A0ABS9HFQ8_9ACTN|nr:hypothetical protein [Nocardioides potassii]MCF6379186.1 hypothetical protein [Nocardioides potassii]